MIDIGIEYFPIVKGSCILDLYEFTFFNHDMLLDYAVLVLMGQCAGNQNEGIIRYNGIIVNLNFFLKGGGAGKTL